MDNMEISQINNLDTARMALRWALERLTLLEKRAADSDASRAESDKARQDAQKEAEAARKTLSEREEYFKKVEDMTILTPDAKAGVEAVAKRGLENERAFEAVLNGLKRRLALAEDAARRSQSMTESREALLTERERQWLKEKEDLISRHAVTGRGAERAWERQKSELMRERSELNRIRLLEAAESDRAEEAVRRAGTAWSEEKAQLLAEIDLWRRKYQSLAEAEAALLREKAELASRLRDAEERHAKELQKAVEEAREAHSHSRKQLSALQKLDEDISSIEKGRDLAARERKLEARSKELAALAKFLEAKLS